MRPTVTRTGNCLEIALDNVELSDKSDGRFIGGRLRSVASRTVVAVCAVQLFAAPVCAQVRIEPTAPAQPSFPAAARRTTWADQLGGRSLPRVKPPTPENYQSCPAAVTLPDTLAIVGGPGGVSSVDVWQDLGSRWARFVDPPNTPDTVRGRVVGADCAVLPVRIVIRTPTDYVAINPGTLRLDGVLVAQPGGGLVPAVVRVDDVSHEVHVEPMSALAVKHLHDPPPDSPAAREAALRYVRPKFRRAVRERLVLIGMTEDEARLAWGEPDHVNTTETQNSYTEQWVYPYGRYVYVEHGVVTAIQQ